MMCGDNSCNCVCVTLHVVLVTVSLIGYALNNRLLFYIHI